jgi:O-antigen ligase
LAKPAPKIKARADSAELPQGRAYALGWRLFLALVAVVPVVLVIWPPQLGFLAQFRALDPVDLPKTVAILVFSGLSLAAFCVSVVRGESELRWHPVLWILVALFGWAAVSTVFSASRALSVFGDFNSNEGLVAIFGYGLVAFLAVQYVRSGRALRTVMVAAVVSGLAVSAYGLAQAAGVDPIGWVGEVGQRAFATFGNPDKLGTYLLFPLAMAVGLALSTRPRRSSLGWWAAVAFISMALIATGTRGAWLGALAMIVCLVIGVWSANSKTTSRGRIVVGAVALAILAALSTAIVLIRPRGGVGVATLSSLLARVSNGRTVIWATGLRGWLARPMTGWGPDGFERAFNSAVGADWYALINGLQGAKSAHSMIVQTLVTLGIPGLVLALWALGYTAIASFRSLRATHGAERLQLLAVWSALIGIIVSLSLGLTEPPVSVWLWLTVGMLLAQLSRPVTAPRRVLVAAGAALGVTLAVWAGTWLVADIVVGPADQTAAGAARIAAYQTATKLNPLDARYRWMLAEALVNEAVAEQRAGGPQQSVDATMLRAIEAYHAAAQADPSDPLVRIAMANVLTSYGVRHPDTNASQRAIEVAQEAVRLAPRNPAALAVLAKEYQAAGLLNQAEKTARLAHSVAPEYARQTLGPLGLDTSSTP